MSIFVKKYEKYEKYLDRNIDRNVYIIRNITSKKKMESYKHRSVSTVDVQNVSPCWDDPMVMAWATPVS